MYDDTVGGTDYYQSGVISEDGTYYKPDYSGITNVDDIIEAGITLFLVQNVAGRYVKMFGGGVKELEYGGQNHHFLSDKNNQYTSEFEKITDKYGLDLADDWNTQMFPRTEHSGRHTNNYHDFMLDSIRDIDRVAQGNKNIFLELFTELKQKIVNDPSILYK